MRITFKYGYAFVILFMITSMTIGAISRSYYILKATDCLPQYIFIFMIVGLLLYLTITIFYIRSKKNLFWGLLMYIEAMIFSFIIGMTILQIKKQNIQNIHIENSITDSKITIKRKTIEKETGRKIFISYGQKSINVRFKKSADNKKDQEIIRYIKESLSSSNK